MKVLTGLRLLWAALVRRDDYARFQIAERAARALDPGHVSSEYGRTFLEDEGFRKTYESIEGSSNLRSLDRKFVVDQLCKLALEVPGDTAECGVLRGVSSRLICLRTRGSGKRHHVFDSFEGLSPPDRRDGQYWNQGDLAVDENTVRRTLAEFEFVSFHRGWIPERFADVENERFALVHIDVDLYRPTLDSLAFFYERTSAGAIIISDDYGFRSCPGARAAFDEFMAGRPEPIVELPTGQAIVIRGA